MYCSTCGAEVPGELNYCNRCGASLNASTQAPAPPIAPLSFTKLAMIIATMLILGMGIVFAAMDKMMDRGVGSVAIVWITLFGLATLFGVTAMFLRLWAKVSGIAAPAPRLQQTARQQTLREPLRVAQLPPRPVGFSSVTENTTRTFDPIYRDVTEQQK